MAKNKYQIPTFNFQQIQIEWEKFLSLGTKEKLNSVRSFVFNIENVENVDYCTPEQINELLSMLKECKKHIFNCKDAINKALAKMTARYLRSKGIMDPQITLKKSKSINTEVAAFMVADMSTTVALKEVSDKALCQVINQGQAFFLLTGSDGVFKVTLVLVDVNEPLLPTKILKSIYSSSDPAVIACPSGELAVFSDCFDNPSLKIKLEPGNYKVAAYSKESHAGLDLFIVVAKTNEEAKNNCQEISSIG